MTRVPSEASASMTQKQETPCFHCGLPAYPEFSVTITGERRAFCCAGCCAVAQMIYDGGLSDFYRYRDDFSATPEEGLERFDAYDIAEVQADFVETINDDVKRVTLLIGNISCAACAWLIENYLESVSGVDNVHVNVSSHLCIFEWREAELPLSKIFSTLHSIGYRPKPGTHDNAQSERIKMRRSALLRIGVAGLGMMQVGMVGIALHAGALQGIEAYWQHFLRWVSLLFALPVIFFSARPFFDGAWRSLRLKRLTMDVPVSLALLLAFIASVYGTWTNLGDVYFDSVAMFTFFLLLGRYLEMRARHTSIFEIEKLSQLLPLSAERYRHERWELVPMASINPGDRLRVAAGEVVPCDGLLLSHRAMLDESMLTGESELLNKKQGEAMYAGSLLADTGMEMTVTATKDATRLAAVQNLLNTALQQKPRQQQLADKVAGRFVAGVLVFFVTVWVSWLLVDSTRAFWVALSVLVVTCPCALSLATPTALAAGLNYLRRLGFLVMSPNALATLPQITDVVFDKTGTLTEGRLKVLHVELLAAAHARMFSVEDVLSIVAGLEAPSRHPIASAFSGYVCHRTVRSHLVYPGLGVEAQVDAKCYRFGKPAFAVPDQVQPFPGDGAWHLLGSGKEAIAWVQLGDRPREHIHQALEGFYQQGITVHLFSGDRGENVEAFVNDHIVPTVNMQARGDMSPEDKLMAVQTLQKNGRKVMMVGDGINDVPVLAAADISVAMGSASKLAKVNADTLLLNQNLSSLLLAGRFSHRIQHIIQQNFLWALGYNLCALPAAALGFIPPWLAAIGMSISSLVVVLNSLRLGRGLRASTSST